MLSLIEKAVAKAKSSAERKPAEMPVDVQLRVNSRSVDREPSTAAIEAQTMERNKIMPAVDDKAAVAAYKVLRTRALQRMRSNQWRTVVVTAADAQEGKTLTACNLAVSIAKDVNQSVFLVDLDLQHPSISDYFGLDIQAGIGEFLTGAAEFDDVIYSPEGLDRIFVIPNRAPVENASELIASPRMKILLKRISEHSGKPYAIFDMPPVLACDDVLAFLPSVDSLLFVVSEGNTQRSRLAKAVEMLGNVNLLGVVLNRSRELRRASSYY